MKAKAQNTSLACIILAAGKGTRMKSKLPKVMHAIAHKPMLMHVIDTAKTLGAKRIVTVTSPDMEKAREAVKRTHKNVENAIQPQQLGTGDAVKAAQSAFKDFDGIVFILYGDTPLIRAETLQSMADALKTDSKIALAVLGMEVPLPNAYGRLITDKKGDLDRIVEAMDANAKEKKVTLCNSGVMAVRGKLLFTLLARLNAKNAKGEYYLTDIVGFARKAEHRCIVLPADAEELQGINSRAELAKAEASLQARLRAEAMAQGATLIAPETVFFSSDTKLGSDVIIHPHVIFGPGVEVGNEVEIRSFCHIEGSKVAAHAIIGPFARLRPGAVIGEEAHIGNFVEVKQSVIARGAKANHLSYIGDAEVGERSNIGAGTITANYDGFAKHRTIIGAGVSIGSDTVLVAPVNVGDNAIIGAGSIITEDVEPEALAIARARQEQKPRWAKAFREKQKR